MKVPLLFLPVLIGLGFLSCATTGQLNGPPQAGETAGWITIFDGRSLDGWTVVQGSARLQDGRILLNDDGRGDSTILAKGVDLKDGQLEVDVLRLDGPDDAPYTLTLRLPLRLDWSGVYFVCRPLWLEATRGSARLKFPQPEARADYARAGQAETWRFVLNGRRIDCYRAAGPAGSAAGMPAAPAEPVLSYDDPEPRAGTIALTARNCRLALTSARYLPAE